jgi:uncharacterized protein YdeI (YjbR/CyaY-like superfamily)
MNKKSPKVDGVLRQEKKWQEEFETLRTIILDCQLAEELKWYQPCYTLQKKNVVLIHGFKEFCALLFFKGALLKDPIAFWSDLASIRQPARFASPMFGKSSRWNPS